MGSIVPGRFNRRYRHPDRLAVTPAFWERTDLVCSSEVPPWTAQDGRYDGMYALNYGNTSPKLPQLIQEAAIKVARWKVWDTFTDVTNPTGGLGSMPRAQFDNIIDGIRNTLGAFPMITLQPIQNAAGNGTPDFANWGAANLLIMGESIIRQAEKRARLYEFCNEPGNAHANTGIWVPSSVGTSIGAQWIINAPLLKKYARSLGFEIFLGGPAETTTGIDQFGDSQDTAKATQFMTAILNEYNNVSSPYYHDLDLKPDFYSFHIYPVEYLINIYGPFATQADEDASVAAHILEGVPYYATLIGNIRAAINAVWGTTIGNTIPLVCSEWNIQLEAGSFPSPATENAYAAFLAMFKANGVIISNQFMATGEGNKMDMIAENGLTVTPYYSAFKAEAIKGRN